MIEFVVFFKYLYCCLWCAQVISVPDTETNINDDDFEYPDDPDYTEDPLDNDEEDDDDTPLALRAKRKAKSSPETKRKRGRPPKSALKVPPLRIKAVKPKKSVAFVDPSATDGTSTRYEIREDGTEDPLIKSMNFFIFIL